MKRLARLAALAAVPAFVGVVLAAPPAQAAYPAYSCTKLTSEPSPNQQVVATGCTPLNGAPAEGLAREPYISWPGGLIQCLSGRVTPSGDYVTVRGSACSGRL